MQVVLATRNAGKLRELSALLTDLPLDLCSLDRLGIASPEETGTTFIENALLKARSATAAAGMPAIADDSGLVVPSLHGAPGVYSARYAGAGATDADNNALLIERLQGFADRRAFFYCAMVMLSHEHDPTPLVATGAWHGHIVDSPRGGGGFGYDPLFLVGDDLTSAELPADEKNRLSHRGLAAGALAAQLRQRFAHRAQ